MKLAALKRLQRLLGLASTAEASRLAGVMAEITACRARADRLRGEIGGSGVVVSQGNGRRIAAELAAVSRWDIRLAERARVEEVRAMELEAEAAAIRQRLARAFGRETAAATMAEKARIEERRLAALRAEAGVITPESARLQDQAVSSGSEPFEISAGSPGIE